MDQQVMDLYLDTAGRSFQVSQAPEPKIDFVTKAQQVQKSTGLPVWEVGLIMRAEGIRRGAEVITVRVAGEQPKVTTDQLVTVKGFRANPWLYKDRDTGEVSLRISFRADAIVSAAVSKAA